MSKDTKGKAMGNLGSTRLGGVGQDPPALMGRQWELFSQVPLKHLGTVTDNVKLQLTVYKSSAERDKNDVFTF